jgi:outer membrane protein OmpA-like peptidoglycan-associated protein
MIFMKTPVIFALCGAMALGACPDPSTLGGNPNDPNQKTKQGAAAGAAAGAILGVLVSNKDDRAKGAITGALVGAGVGAGVGYSLDKQEADLRRDLGNNNVTIQNTGDRLIVTLPQDILFASGSFSVRSDLRRDLGTVASNLQAYPNSTIQIVGHTDSDGDAGSNQVLSERRANAVADILLDAGIPFSRVQAFGRGENQPVASNLDPAGKSKNRRVEIVILPNAS